MSNSLHFDARRRSVSVPTLFAALEPDLKDRLIKASPARLYSDGQFIQHRGSRPDGFWLIETGSVRVGQHLPDGEFRAVAVLGPGDSYGELAVFSGNPRIVDALSRGDSNVRFIAAQAFLKALESDPKSSRSLLGALSAQLQNTLNQLSGMRRGSNPTRLAEMLNNLADEQGVTAMTQQELAELLGVSRATANSALRTLETAGFVERGYGHIRIVRREAMALFALQG